MRKAFLFAFLGLVSPFSGAIADQIAVSTFKGLNSNENALIIDPAYAQDELNVNITPGGKSVQKGAGYGLYKTLYSSNLQGIHGGSHFFDATGNDVQVWGSSTSLYGIVADAAPAQLVSSATLNATWDCADTQGFGYCVDSSRDALIKTNGATITWYSSVLGTMVEATPDRLVVAGVSGNTNTLYISGSNAFTTFTAGPLPSDPFTEPIASPGSKLTHTRWGCGKLLWWKDQSFGWFAFDDQYSAQVKIVSDTIGTFDNTSAIDPGGNVWFRGQDGHIWEYDCSGLIKQSIEITPQIQASGKRVSNSWIQTSGSDFNSGSSVNVDTTTMAGNVMLNGFSDTFSSLSNWTTTSGVWSISGGHAQTTNTSVNAGLNQMFSVIVDSISSAFLMSYQCGVTGGLGTQNVDVQLVNASNNGYRLDYSGDGTANLYRLANGTPSLIIAGAVVAHDQNTHTVSLSRTAAGLYTIFLDTTNVGNVTDNTYIGFSTAALRVAGMFAGQTASIYNFSIYDTTGTYYSSVKNAPSLNSWTTFGSNTSGVGSQTFYMRSSSNSFTVLSSTPAWTTQITNTQVAVATNTYFQVRDDFSITAATNIPVLADFSVNWFEGSAVDQAYSIYFDNAILFSVSYGVGVSSNTYILKRDLINDGWLLYNFGAGGMLVQNNHLFFGDVGSTAQIFQYGSGTSYNGTAINAYWKSKNFTGADPFMRNQYTNIDTLFKQNTSQTITTTYALDGSTTTTSYTVNLSSTSLPIINNRKNLPNGKNGYTINLQYGDNTISSAWELLGYRFTFMPQPYVPSQ